MSWEAGNVYGGLMGNLLERGNLEEREDIRILWK
jgi:hypothetical protein